MISDMRLLISDWTRATPAPSGNLKSEISLPAGRVAGNQKSEICGEV
jgi:hypothetical protein